MANLRISQLPAATTVASADLLPFSSVAGSETRRITAQNLGLALTQLGLTVGSTAPTTPYNGQIWVDTSTNPPVVKVWNGVTFTVVSFLPGSSISTNPSGTAPATPILGQLWQDTSQTPDELKMYDGANWVRVDPDGIDQTFADGRYLQITTAASTYLALSGGTLTGNLTLAGAPSTTLMAATKGYVDSQIAALPAAETVPAGTVIWTARNTAPTGYLKANGAAISRTTYSGLFSAIGTLYGPGDGSTTFNLPDLRGEFIRGWDDGRGIDTSRTMGSAQSQAYLSHTHAMTSSIGSVGDHSHSWGGIGGSGGNNAAFGSGYAVTSNTTGGAGAHTHSISVSAANSGGTETRPRNVAMLACIKT